MGGFIDYYELLGVSPSASEELIKKAYRIAAKSAHPDSGGSEADFVLLHTAYETLTDKVRRMEYDEIYIKAEYKKYRKFNETEEEMGKENDFDDKRKSNDLSANQPTSHPEEREKKPKWRFILSGLSLLILLPKAFNNFSLNDDSAGHYYYFNEGDGSIGESSVADQLYESLKAANLLRDVTDTTTLSEKSEDTKALEEDAVLTEEARDADNQIELEDLSETLIPNNELEPKVSVHNSVDSSHQEDNLEKTFNSEIGKFSMGSSKEEVLAAMGTPTQISSYINQWNYGLSSIDFDDNDKVSGWNNYKGNLHVHIAHAQDGSTFTTGSSKAEVLRAMGTPTQISSYINQWNYGLSSIDFDDNDKVSGWNNYKGNLHVHIAHAQDGSTFTIGSSKADVLRAMGTPTQISSYINQWYYELSSINFDDNDKVSGWNNYKNNLKVK